MSNRHRKFRGLCAVAALLALAGYADPATLALGGASAVTAADTGKTVTDHAMTYLTGDDCSFKHSLKGIAWCQPARGEVEPPARRVCYQSIAAISCYLVENSYETETRRTP
jgi:hypothetical protein